MSGKILKRALALCLCMLLLAGSCLAEDSLEDFVPDALTEEELAQWQEWAEEGMGDSDATAANAAELTPEEESLMAEMASMLEDTTVSTEVDLSNLEPNEALPDYVVNILLLGVDNRSVELVSGRADANIICSINTQDGSIKLTSIQRDLLVTIPPKKNPYKITNAYSWGGGQLSMATVNQNFELNIDKFVTINFYGLAAIIDYLGGVDIELTKTEASRINYELKKEPLPFDTNPDRDKVEAVAGVHHLDGMQAVTYARIRGISGENDFNRSERQRKLLEVLLEQVMQDMSLDRMVELISVAMPYVLTNMSASDMATLGMQVLSSGIVTRAQQGEDLMEQMRVPMDETWKYDESNGSSVIAFRTTARKQENIEALHAFIYGEYIPAN